MAAKNSTGPVIADPVSKTLDALDRTGWRVLHTTRWPGHPGHHVAHVVVGPGGIVVLAEPHTPVHDEVVDPHLEDLACATAAVTALVAPRHRRLVRGMTVTAPGVELPSRVTCVDSDSLVAALSALPAALSPVEVVLASAYLRDQLNASGRGRPGAQVPRPSRPVDQSDKDSGFPDPHARPPRWWRRFGPDLSTTLIVVAGLVAPWAIAAALHQV